jgi:ubiquinone/menaquinone biosynthesis C-methylase UbiE
MHRKVGKHVVNNAVHSFANDLKTLDIGCGAGIYKASFPNHFGVDVVEGPGVDKVADAHDLPFADGEFEQIILSEVLEHLHSPARAVEEMARVLKPEGRLILTVPFVYPLHEAPHDYQRYTEYGLRKLLGGRFKDIEIKALFSEEQTIAILVQRIALQRRSGLLRRLIYVLLANIIFRCGPRNPVDRNQSLSGVSGPFLTATYLVTASRIA